MRKDDVYKTIREWIEIIVVVALTLGTGGLWLIIWILIGGTFDDF